MEILERCPYCNHTEVIWDYERGYLVCPNCGSVLMPLITNAVPSPERAKDLYSTDWSGIRTVRESLQDKVRASYARHLSRIVKEVTLYERYARRARKNVEVNLDALMNGRGKERVYKHRNDDQLQRLVEQDDELKRVLEAVVERDPVFSSRTYRGKVAIALMLKYIIHGEEPNLEEIIKLTSISRTHAKRLYRLVLARLSKSLARA